MITAAVPQLEDYDPRSGIGRVLHGLAACWDEVRLAPCPARRLPLPLLRNLPYAAVPPPGADLVLLPQLTGAQMLARTGGLPSLAMVHDIGVIDFPGDRGNMPWLGRQIVSHGFRRLDRASHIVTVSEFTKRRLLARQPALAGRVTAIPNGVGEQFLRYDAAPAAARRELERAAGRALGAPLLVYVGSELPRKNIGLLLDVLAETRRRHPGAVLLKIGGAGGAEFRAATLRACAARGLAPGAELIFLERIDDELLAHAYGAADIVVCCSLYEGFGLPVLEALAVGSPVVAADRGGLPEAAGDAGLVAAPETGAFAAAIDSVLGQSGEAERRRAARKAHAGQWTWRRAADRYLALMRRLIGAAPAGGSPGAA